MGWISDFFSWLLQDKYNAVEAWKYILENPKKFKKLPLNANGYTKRYETEFRKRFIAIARLMIKEKGKDLTLGDIKVVIKRTPFNTSSFNKKYYDTISAINFLKESNFYSDLNKNTIKTFEERLKNKIEKAIHKRGGWINASQVSNLAIETKTSILQGETFDRMNVAKTKLFETKNTIIELNKLLLELRTKTRQNTSSTLPAQIKASHKSIETKTSELSTLIMEVKKSYPEIRNPLQSELAKWIELNSRLIDYNRKRLNISQLRTYVSKFTSTSKKGRNNLLAKIKQKISA